MRFKTLLSIALTTISVATCAEPIKYTVLVKGEKTGSLVAETTGDDDSGYVDESTLTLTKDGKSMDIHEIVHYGKDGIVTSRSMEVTGEEPEVKLKSVLSDDGAKVTAWIGDQKVEKDVPLKTKTSRADATNFWFKKGAPPVGTTVTYQTFDLESSEWSDVTLKFVGKVKVTIGDKTLEENEIDRTEGDQNSKVYVDDNNDAVLIEDGDMRIERIFTIST
jgi:hypothetical protein